MKWYFSGDYCYERERVAVVLSAGVTQLRLYERELCGLCFKRGSGTAINSNTLDVLFYFL
jgi:hypothetical protein